MVSSSHRQIAIVLLSAFILTVESHSPLFSHCPAPRVINATGLFTRVWWSSPAVYPYVVRSVRRMGPPSGSLFPTGNHSIIYQAKGFNATTENCEVSFTIQGNNRGSLFAQCPAPMVINATTVLTRVWWRTPTVRPYLVRSVRRDGSPPGTLFEEGRHSIVYQAFGYDGTYSICEVIFTINVQKCQRVTPTSPTLMRCSNDNVAYSHCRFFCPRGYQLIGSSSTMCRSSGEWSRTFPACREIVCDSLTAPSYSSMRCSFPHGRQGSWCQFQCFSGFYMEGSSVRTCMVNGWSGVQPSCMDFRSPVFVNCPKSIRVRNEEGMDSALVNYEKPIAFDSSNVTVELISGQQSGERFDLGIHRIYYRAEDESGNSATCTFYILVIDSERPVFDFCPAPIHASTRDLSTAVPVTYQIPTATDNSPSVNITRISGEASGSVFFPGIHPIHYRAQDEAGNQAFCYFYVVVKVSPCDQLVESEHLQMNCSEKLYSIDSNCTFKCDEGFVLFGSAIRICENTGWSGQAPYCIAEATPTSAGTETISENQGSTPRTPPETVVTSSGEMETEIIDI